MATSFLTETKVIDLLKDKKVLVTLTEELTIEGALDTLSKHGIQSAPFRTKEGHWIGLIDVVDLLTFSLFVGNEEKDSELAPPSTNLEEDNLNQLSARMKEFSLTRLSQVNLCDISLRNPYVVISAKDPLYNVVTKFAAGIHRVVVSAENEAPCHILTQSDLIQAIAENCQERLGSSANKTLEQLGLLGRVVTVNQKTKVVDAFSILWDLKISGLGLVDDNGELVGNISAADVKFLKDFNYAALLQTCGEFVAHNLSTAGKNRPLATLVSVDKGSTLADTVKLLAENRLHRVYIVDSSSSKPKFPHGILTLTDIAQILSLQRYVN